MDNIFDLTSVESEATGWNPLSPGLNIPAVLTAAEWGVNKEKETTENVQLTFVGTGEDKGTLNYNIWASAFDPSDEYYSDDERKKALARIAHILTTYYPKDTIAKSAAGAKNWKQFATVIIKALNAEHIAKTAVELKVVYDAKDKPTFPKKPAFIKSENNPDRTFYLNTFISQYTGLPIDRIEKIAKPNEGSSIVSSNDTVGFDSNTSQAPQPEFGSDTVTGEEVPF